MKYYLMLLLVPIFILASCNGGDDAEGEAEVPAGQEVAKTGTENANEIGRALAGAINAGDFDSLNRYILSAAELELHYKKTDAHKEEYDRQHYQNLANTIKDTLRQQFNSVRQQITQKNFRVQQPTEDNVQVIPMQLTSNIPGMRVEVPLQGTDSLRLSGNCVKVVNNFYLFDNIALIRKTQ